MTTATGGYNGWSNRETWNANLWMNNEESLYKLIGTIARGCENVSELASNMEGFLGILWNGKTPDGDILHEVNWVEIATAWAEANELFDNAPETN